MKIETLNPYVLKIIIAARKQDSISAIAKRIGISYGWTYKWVKQLENLGVFKCAGKKLFLNKSNKFYRRFLEFIKKNFKNDIAFHYSVLQLFGIKYCFTATDAVFIWTKGGYNIARYKGYYPIFLRVKKADYGLFAEYCKKLDLAINAKSDIFYQVEILPDFDFIYVGGIPVDSLKKTTEFMIKHIYNFQPALEMIQELYGKKLKVKYAEVKYV